MGLTILIMGVMFMGLPKNNIPSGIIFTMNCGAELEVLNYNNATDILIQFTDKLSLPFKAHIGNIRKGEYKNKYQPYLYGVGYEGIGKYSYKTDKFAARSWRGIITRGYSVIERLERPTTEDVTVCEEWHNFQNFAEWATQQKGYGIKGFEIDKDLLILNNSNYSPETCCYIPREINTRLPKRYASHDKVYYYKQEGLYKAYYTEADNKRKSIQGTDKEALAYERKVILNRIIKEISTKYFPYLDEAVIKRLSNYYQLGEY